MGEMMQRGVYVLLMISIARILGVGEFGKFQFALALVSLFALFSDMGISDIIPREFSRSPLKERDFPSLLSLKLLFALGTFVGMVALSFLVTQDLAIRHAILVLTLFLIFRNFLSLFFAFFQARQRMHYEALLKGVHGGVLLVVGMLVLWKAPSLANVSYGYLLATFAALVASLVFFHVRIRPLSLEWNRPVWIRYLKSSLPIGFASLMGGVYLYFSSALLGYWGYVREVGWYNAAFQLAGAAFLGASLVALAFGPALSKAWAKSQEELRRIWSHFLSVMVVLALPLVVGGFSLAPKLVDFLYGSSYARAIPVLEVFSLIIGFYFLYLPFGVLLVVSNKEKKYFLCQFVGAVSYILLSLIGIPFFGLQGAVGATVGGYAILLILGILFARNFTPTRIVAPDFLRVVLAASISALLMGIALGHPIFSSFHVIVVGLVGLGIYFTFLLFFYRVHLWSFSRV